jgi:uncharacterized membrane protein
MLIEALYPRKEDLESLERLTLSIGLSLAVVPLIGLFLNYLHRDKALRRLKLTRTAH